MKYKKKFALPTPGTIKEAPKINGLGVSNMGYAHQARIGYEEAPE